MTRVYQTKHGSLNNMLTIRNTNVRVAKNRSEAQCLSYLSSLLNAMSNKKTGLDPSLGITDMYDIANL